MVCVVKEKNQKGNEMKTIKEIKEICGGLATVQKVRGENSAKITFHKNWGHGKLGGDKSQGTLGQLAEAGFHVEAGSHGNIYRVDKA